MSKSWFNLPRSNVYHQSLETRDTMKSTKEKVPTAQSRTLTAKPSDKVDDSVRGACEKHSVPASSANVQTGKHSNDDPKSSKASEIDSIKNLTLPSEVEASPTIKEQLEYSETRCQILRAQVLELRKNLQDAHDFIFSSQPRLKTLTEDEARSDFNTLCGSVQELVDRKLGDALDDRSLVKEKAVVVGPANRLLLLIPAPGRESFNYSGTDEYNITAAILMFLCIEVFDKDFYSYVGDAERALISIDKGMRSLEPRRDLVTLRTWRCETYSAIANRPEFPQILQARKNSVATQLTDMLNIFNPQVTDYRTLSAAVRNTIVEPAFALAQKIHLSVDKFSIEWHHKTGSTSDQLKRLERNFNGFEWIDLAAGGKPLKAQPVGNIHYIVDIAPALVYRSVKADSYAEQKVLSKPKLLVAVTREGHGPPPDDKTHSARRPTVLGWIEETLRDFMEKNGRAGIKQEAARR